MHQMSALGVLKGQITCRRGRPSLSRAWNIPWGRDDGHRVPDFASQSRPDALAAALRRSSDATSRQSVAYSSLCRARRTPRLRILKACWSDMGQSPSPRSCIRRTFSMQPHRSVWHRCGHLRHAVRGLRAAPRLQRLEGAATRSVLDPLFVVVSRLEAIS